MAIAPETFGDFDLTGRNSERLRGQIQTLLGFRPFTMADADTLAAWLGAEVLPADQTPVHLQERVLDWCRDNRIEPPTFARTERIVRSALRTHESALFEAISEKLSERARQRLDALLKPDDADTEGASADDDQRERTPFADLRADSGRVGLETVLKEKVQGKTTLLYRLAEAAIDNPQGIVREVLFPVVGEDKLGDLVREYRASGPAYGRQLHTVVRGS